MSDEMPEFTDEPHRWTIEPHLNSDYDICVTNSDEEARRLILETAEMYLWDGNEGEERVMKVTLNPAIPNAERAGEAAPRDEPPIEMQREWVDAYDLLEALKSAEQQRVCMKCGHDCVASDGICDQSIDTENMSPMQMVELRQEFWDDNEILRCGCKCVFTTGEEEGKQ